MMKRTSSGEKLTDLVLEIFQLNGALIDAGNAITRPHGLTSARWQVMGAIDLAGSPLTVSQIARRMGLSRQAVQRIVNDLRGLSMISLETNLDHKRAPLVSLSKEGAKILKSVDQAQIEWINQLSDGVSKNRVDDALEILKAIRSRSHDNPPTK